MLRIFKKVVWLAVILAAVHRASAFSIWGPAESWQTTELDYLTRYFYSTTELGGTKNFGQGSRLNVPIITYTYDYTFLSYFGVEGVKAVDSAMNVLNALPGASDAKLARFITQGVQQANYSAQAMSLLDLKSEVLGIMLEHMGLIGETHVYDLRTRQTLAGTCNFDYYVITRNYDPVTYDPTPYVNGTLYNYYIADGCPIGVSVGDAIEILPDATTPPSSYTAVATQEGLLIGGYYTGLSRDDMGGLRYLYRNENFNNEVLDSEAIIGPNTSSGAWQIVNTNAGNTGTTNFGGIFGGVEKITFVKVNFDSFLSTAFNPIVYHYNIPYITNGGLRSLPIVRTVIQPDIIFSAADLVNTGVTPAADIVLTRSVNFLTNGLVPPGGGGVAAGVIAPQMDVVFNTVGAIYFNGSPSFLDQNTPIEYPIFIWGSFDGSTNAPIVFPNGTSIAELEEQVMSGGSSLPPGTWNPFSTNNSTTNTTAAVTP
jgi:hypothetical protein